MAIHFKGSPEPTVGIEVELQIVDPETKELCPMGPEIIKRYGDPKYVKPELFQATVEINTKVCKNIKEVKADLTEKISDVLSIADEIGVALMCAGSHPTAALSEQKVTVDERYRAILERIQWPVKRLLIFGIHVHVGIESGEKAIAIFNVLCNYLPHLLALSASSPYWEGVDTGLQSSRVKVFENLPTGGLPFRMINWGEFQRFMKTMKRSGAIRTIREVWWDIRPHPDFGTVEIRVCDGLPTIKEIVAIAAMIQSLVVKIGRDYDEGVYLPTQKIWIIKENKWRAARWSTNAQILVDEEGNVTEISQDIEELILKLSPVARELDCYDELKWIEEILNVGASSFRQRNIFKQTNDFKSVVQSLTDELRMDKMITNV